MLKVNTDVSCTAAVTVSVTSREQKPISQQRLRCVSGCYICCPFLEIDTSQGTGRVWSNFRRACLCIVQHKFFEVVVLRSSHVLLVVSKQVCVCEQVFEDIYLGHHPVLQRVLKMADLVFTFVFLVEMLLKWIAFGFKKYFTSFWCWLDFLILDVSLFSLMGNMLGYTSRPLRALRTLRVPSRFKGMRVRQALIQIQTLPSRM
uniref:Ion transport domain-containing protein n=1 Tax=Neolamprologus brichardi TaxID=32507 RepID=A0A3Q4I0J2_NEOBR